MTKPPTIEIEGKVLHEALFVAWDALGTISATCWAGPVKRVGDKAREALAQIEMLVGPYDDAANSVVPLSHVRDMTEEEVAERYNIAWQRATDFNNNVSPTSDLRAVIRHLLEHRDVPLSELRGDPVEEAWGALRCSCDVCRKAFDAGVEAGRANPGDSK